MIRQAGVAALLGAVAVAAAVALADDWPQWRGAAQTGVAPCSQELVDCVACYELKK
jgi:hypothetical protein